MGGEIAMYGGQGAGNPDNNRMRVNLGGVFMEYDEALQFPESIHFRVQDPKKMTP